MQQLNTQIFWKNETVKKSPDLPFTAPPSPFFSSKNYR
jgi:hypothetical protein